MTNVCFVAEPHFTNEVFPMEVCKQIIAKLVSFLVGCFAFSIRSIVLIPLFKSIFNSAVCMVSGNSKMR